MKAYRFELDGSKPNPTKFYPFSIDYMKLVIEPDLKSNHNNLVNCREELGITTTRDIKEIELDIAELKILKVSALTQGETIESRYWFPCLDDPQVKFPREIHVIVPKDFIVVSKREGEAKSMSINSKNSKEKKFRIWKHNE